MSINKRLVVVSDENSIGVSLNQDLSGISEMKLDYFKMTGLTLATIPDYIYLKIDGDPNVRSNQVIYGTRQGFTQVSSGLVPVYFKTDVTGTFIHGKQPTDTAWKHRNLRNMNNFRVTLVDTTGTPLMLPVAAMFQLVFDVKYDGEKTWGDSKKNLQAWT